MINESTPHVKLSLRIMSVVVQIIKTNYEHFNRFSFKSSDADDGPVNSCKFMLGF